MSAQDKIFNILTEYLGLVDIEKVSVTSDLKEDLGADRLDTIELAMAFEEEFSIEISNDEIDKIKTVQDIISLVGERLMSVTSDTGQMEKDREDHNKMIDRKTAFNAGLEKACKIIQQEMRPINIDLTDFIRMRTGLINSIRKQIK